MLEVGKLVKQGNFDRLPGFFRVQGKTRTPSTLLLWIELVGFGFFVNNLRGHGFKSAQSLGEQGGGLRSI